MYAHGGLRRCCQQVEAGGAACEARAGKRAGGSNLTVLASNNAGIAVGAAAACTRTQPVEAFTASVSTQILQNLHNATSSQTNAQEEEKEKAPAILLRPRGMQSLHHKPGQLLLDRRIHACCINHLVQNNVITTIEWRLAFGLHGRPAHG